MPPRLLSLVDAFLPPAVRQEADVHARARLFVASHFAAAPFGLLVAGYLVLTEAAPGLEASILVGAVSALWLYPVALRLTGKFDLLTALSLEHTALIVLFGAYNYGGLSSPFLPWLLGLPVIAIFHFAARPAIEALIFAVLALHLAGLYWLYTATTELASDRLFIAVGLFSVFGAALFVAVTAIYNSTILSAQKRALQREVEFRLLTEAKLRETSAEAERASRAKSEFLANMSHELRTPLNAIIGFSEIISAQMLGPIGTKQYAGYSEDISRSGKHLLKIIGEILDLTKIETGKFVLSEGSFDLSELVARTVDEARAGAAERGIELALQGADGAVTFHGDEGRVRQMLQELLSNAVKFTGRGGAVTVVLTAEPGRGIGIEIADTGIGIPAADIHRVLLPFEQVGQAMARSTGGTGLGLPLARELAMQHGGSLTLESELGRGTTVRVLFPRERVRAAAVQYPSSAA